MNAADLNKLLRVRALELRPGTEGEGTAAAIALDRLLAKHGVEESKRSQSRSELDQIQAKLDAHPGSKLVGEPPPPVVQFVFVGGWGTASATTGTSTAWWGP